jgi:hypothetical protein
MKKTVYNYMARGSRSSIELEILLDVNRELTDVDNRNIRESAENLVAKIHEETIAVDPESKTNALKERQEIISVFAGRNIYVEEIPNGYCSQYCCKHLPWFVVTTNKGRIKIGWRKRVISIDWSDSIIKETAEILFPSEDVTKYDNLIHAWGLEKAREYIDKLLG